MKVSHSNTGLIVFYGGVKKLPVRIVLVSMSCQETEIAVSTYGKQ